MVFLAMEMGDTWRIHGEYPLVNFHITMENHHVVGKSTISMASYSIAILT
jgi:hypothetical protein